MTNVYTIAHHAPRTGYFVGSFSLRGPRGPAVLRGPFNEIASAISRCPESTTYTFDAISDNWTAAMRPGLDVRPEEMVCDIPWVEREGPPLDHAVHPDTIARIAQIMPVIEAIGTKAEKLSAGKPYQVASSPNTQRFKVVFVGNHHLVEAYADVDARAPFVRWVFLARRIDGQSGSTLRISWPWLSRTMQIDFGAIEIRRIVVPTAIDPTALEQQAIENAIAAYGGRWFGIPHVWGGDLLDQPIVRGRAGGCPWDLRDYMGRDNPNAPGVDPTFGSTWTALLWPVEGLPDPRRLGDLIVWGVDCGFARRPQHWDTLRIKEPDGKHTLHKGQPYDAEDAAFFGVGPQFRTGPDVFTTHDHEHRSVAPLAVCAALTGDVAAREVAESFLAAESWERSVTMDWPQAGRGQGLPWIAGATLARLLDPNGWLVQRWRAHDAKRLEQYHASRKVGPLVTVGGLYTRGSPWVVDGVEQPYSDPYEQATIALALWLSGHVGEAFGHARSLITGLWWDAETEAFPRRCHGAYNQRWRDGDWPHEVRIGQPINDDLRPGGDALGMWVGAGLRVFLLAAKALGDAGDPRGNDPWLPIARAAIRDLDPVLTSVSDGELLAAAHRAWWGTLPELVREPE